MKKIVIFDYDETLIRATTPEGETLSGFYRRNTFFNNLFYKKTNLVKYAREQKANGNLIVICTAREKRIWLKLILFLKRIPCDILIERKKGDKTPSGFLKKRQLLDLIISDNRYIFLDKEFFDDNNENLFEVKKLNIKVYDAKKLI